MAHQKKPVITKDMVESTLLAASRWLSEDAEALARVFSASDGWWSIEIGQDGPDRPPTVVITTEKYDFPVLESEFGDRLDHDGTENRPKYTLHRAER